MGAVFGGDLIDVCYDFACFLCNFEDICDVPFTMLTHVLNVFFEHIDVVDLCGVSVTVSERIH